MLLSWSLGQLGLQYPSSWGFWCGDWAQPYSLFYIPQAPNALFIPGNFPEVFCSNSDSLDWLCPSHSSTSLRSWLNVSLSSSSPSWAICAEVRNFETKSLPCATTCRACAHCTSLFPSMKSALMRTTSLSRRPVMSQQSIGPFLYQHRQPLIFSSHTDIDASMIVSEASQRFIRVQTFEVIDHGGRLRVKVIALQTVKLLSCEFLLRAQMHWYFKLLDLRPETPKSRLSWTRFRTCHMHSNGAQHSCQKPEKQTIE